MVVLTPVETVLSSNQRDVTVLGLSVELHHLLAIGPRSPSFEPRDPVKLKKGTGTGMGTLMPT